MIEVELVVKAYKSSWSSSHPRVEVLARRVVHRHNARIRVEFLARGVKRLRAAALMQFLARGVVQEGPYVSKWNTLLVVLNSSAPLR